jgi:hypothetical protein
MSKREYVLGSIAITIIDSTAFTFPYFIRKSILPFGLLAVISPQLEQIWVVNLSLTSSNNTFALSHLYRSIVLNALNP